MAGDWIKMRTSLLTNPKVNGIARLLEDSRVVAQHLTTGFSGPMSEIVTRNVMRHVTVSSLLVIWGAANEHTRDGIFANADVSDIDDMVGIPGFGEAMESVGWLKYDEQTGSISLPNFNEYNTSGSERSAGAKSAAQRQQEYRDRKKALESDVTCDVTRNRREEKRREEKKEDTPQPPQAGEAVADVQSPSKAGLICRAIKAKGVPGVSPSNPELLALIAKGVPVETFESAAEVCAKSTPPKGLGYLLAIVKRQITEAAAIADGPSAQAADPDSRSAIEAEGIAKGLGKWNEIAEQWHVYKARVRGKSVNGLGLDALAVMASQHAGAH